MTNQERITAHNERLAALKEVASNLPEAGGGGGQEIETCTVTITTLPAYGNIIFNYVENNTIKIKTFGGLPYAINESTISTAIPELQSVLKESDLYCGKTITAPMQSTADITGDIEISNSGNSSANQLGIRFWVFGNGSITVS